MNQPQRILVVEIRTMDNPYLDPPQLSTMTAYQDSDNLYLGWDIEPFKQAVLDAIVHLGSNYRHPLYFNVQVIPGDNADAMIASVEDHRNRARKQRRQN